MTENTEVAAAFRSRLDEIMGCASALRSSGPTPEDLNALSDALERAVDLAHGISRDLIPSFAPADPDDPYDAFMSACARLIDDGIMRFQIDQDDQVAPLSVLVVRAIEALAEAETALDARGGWILSHGNGEYLGMRKGWPIRVSDPKQALKFLTREDAKSWDQAALDAIPMGVPADSEARLLLAIAAQQFRKYEGHHRAKGTAESDEKAEVNARLAGNIEAFLNGDSQAADVACFECGSTERVGTACKPCNPEMAAPLPIPSMVQMRDFKVIAQYDTIGDASRALEAVKDAMRKEAGE